MDLEAKIAIVVMINVIVRISILAITKTMIERTPLGSGLGV